jgi:hypothetical protein
MIKSIVAIKLIVYMPNKLKASIKNNEVRVMTVVPAPDPLPGPPT